MIGSHHREMNDDTPIRDWRDLMAAVGELLLVWGYLEADMNVRLRELYPDVTQSKPQTVLVRWQVAVSLSDRRSHLDVARFQSDLKKLLDVRNLLAHGLVGASADPRRSGEPFVTCEPLTGSKRRILLSEIEDTKQRIDQLRRRSRHIEL